MADIAAFVIGIHCIAEAETVTYTRTDRGIWMTAIRGRNPNVAYIGFRAEKPTHHIEFTTWPKVRIEPSRGNLNREQMAYSQDTHSEPTNTMIELGPGAFKAGEVQYWKLTAMDPIESITLVDVK